MDYELVIKFWRKSLEDEVFLSSIEGELQSVLGDAARVDGYDVSSDEINLFVITPDPKAAFRRVRRILEGRRIVRGVSAASRLVGGAQFTSIWPLRATRAFKLP